MLIIFTIKLQMEVRSWLLYTIEKLKGTNSLILKLKTKVIRFRNRCFGKNYRQFDFKNSSAV